MVIPLYEDLASSERWPSNQAEQPNIPSVTALGAEPEGNRSGL